MQARACSQNHGPSFPFNPRRAPRTTATQNPIEENDPLTRVGHINGCTCKNCIVMPTKMESICYREIRNTLSLIPEGGQCVTQNREFTSRCLKKTEIDFIFRVLSKQHKSNNICQKPIHKTG
ncbi:hypothetical protein XELAEV_18032505mg [Xenopus laevis]|uniref:Uncharacterized protein n=1 Tax=Xenopus laevis TaxID=8355 RepID=A0A974CPM3_XENLA|nr:hypothetical protein XELAEV_18032505mg [Xenopus laevis]